MKSQTTSNKKGSSGGHAQGKRSAAGDQDESEPKSLTDVIGEGLGEDAQKTIEKTLAQASDVVDQTKKYVSQNRGEAIGVGVAIGLAGWALLYTKPGRQLFDALAPKVLPAIAGLATESLNGTKQ